MLLNPAKLKGMIAAASEPTDLWRIDGYLKKQLKRIEEKYDYRYSVLTLLSFAKVMDTIFIAHLESNIVRIAPQGGWLNEADLQGLQEDKTEKIKYLANIHLRREYQP